MSGRARTTTSFLGLILIFGFSSSAAQDKTPVDVPYTQTGVKIDGVLDEEAWRNALQLDLPVETRPDDNTPALVKTDVWVTHDGVNIYFALYCHDPDPNAIRARYADRDNIFADDLININLDTFNDERRNYYFGVNPLGCQRDGIETQDGSDPSWDAIWDSAGRITEGGYIIEVSIPFSCLQFQNASGPQIWGLDISRWYPRSVEHRLGLVRLDRNISSYQGQFMKIRAFENVAPGRNIELTPTVVASSTDVRPGFPGGELENLSRDLEPGLSARWGFASNFSLNATINPDFSQVEADARELDINNRFAIFFPEKRPFFIEGYDFFQTPISAVYTRTMRDPNIGVKLTGKDGSNTFGAYFVQDDLTNLIFPGSQGSSATTLLQESNIGVFRYKRDVGTNTTLGALLTTRNGDDYYNHVFGGDAVIRLDDRNRIDFQYLGSSTKYPDRTALVFNQSDEGFTDDSIYLRYLYQSRSISAYARYEDYGGGFRGDLGFIPQVGYRRFYSGAEYRWLDNDAWWNQVQIRGEYLASNEEDGSLLQRVAALTLSLNADYQSNWLAYVGTGTDAFAGVEYDITEYFFRANAQPTADLNLGFSTNFGDSIDFANNRLGDKVNIQGFATYRLGRNIRVNFNHVYEQFDVPAGPLYTASISQGTIIFHLNARTFFRSILQYVNYDYNEVNYLSAIDPQFSHFFSQWLFSYKLNPTTVLFLGYSDNYTGGAQYGLTQNDRTFFMKVGYTLQY